MYVVSYFDGSGERNRQISENFAVHEFACKDGSRPVFISLSLVELLEAVRAHFGQPVHINSGYRTVSYNASLDNSSPKSQHCNGLAADIVVENTSPLEVYQYLDKALGEHGGVGLYSTFVHVDMRANKSRWDYS